MNDIIEDFCRTEPWGGALVPWTLLLFDSVHPDLQLFIYMIRVVWQRQ